MLNLANHEWKLFTKAQAIWLVILVYMYFIMFLVFLVLSIYKFKDGPVSLDIRVYTEFGGPKSNVQSTLIRML